MKVKNNSTRLIHVGLVSIIPGEEAVIDDAYANAIPADLEVLEGPAKLRSAPAAAAKGAPKAPAAPVVTAPVAPPEAPAAPDLTVTPPVWAPPSV